MDSSISRTRLGVSLIAVLFALFGVVFAADALVETDAERLDGIASSILEARPSARALVIARLAARDPVAVVANRERVWVDPDAGAEGLRGAIDDAVPEFRANARIVGVDSRLTGQRAEITLRLRGEASDARATDVVLALELEDGRFSLLDVRRLR